MFVGLNGVIILVVLIVLIANKISSPLKRATLVLKNLAKGEINVNNKLKIKSKDEVGEISESVNTLIDALERTAFFAKNIGMGKLDSENKLLSEKDTLGRSLQEMRDSLLKAKDEEEKRKQEESILAWTTNGLAKFGEILRIYNTNIHELSFQVLSNLLSFVDAIQGVIFIKNDENINDVFYEISCAIAYEREKK